MRTPGYFNSALVAFIFLLPAAVALLFAWFVWIGNKRPQVSQWRLSAFQWGLNLASAVYLIFALTGYHELRTLLPANGIWLVANWMGAMLWVLSVIGAVSGRGSGRILLLCWAALMFCGVFGTSSVMIP